MPSLGLVGLPRQPLLGMGQLHTGRHFVFGHMTIKALPSHRLHSSSHNSPYVPEEVKVDGGILVLYECPECPEEMGCLQTGRRGSAILITTLSKRDTTTVGCCRAKHWPVWGEVEAGPLDSIWGLTTY